MTEEERAGKNCYHSHFNEREIIINKLKKFRNRFRIADNYFCKSNSNIIYPQEIGIELTNHCNLACIMCPQPSLTRAKGFISEDLFRHIIDQAAGSVDLVYLHGTGESLMHPKLFEFARYAHECGLTICLSTNGTLMDENASRELLSSGIDFLIVSLDGGTKETYESIRKKGNFDELVANIKNFLALKAQVKTNMQVSIQMICMKKTIPEKELFLNLFSPEEKSQVDQFRFKPFYIGYTQSKRTFEHSRPCFWLWNMMHITWNGDVALCCIDADVKHKIGNVREQTIAEIWNGEPIKQFRALHLKGRGKEIAMCAKCDIPEQGYFNTINILGTTLLDASKVRKLLPVYEKMFLGK